MENYSRRVPSRASFWDSFHKAFLSEPRLGTLFARYPFTRLILECYLKKSPFTRLVLKHFPKRVLSRASFWSAFRKEFLFAARFGTLSVKCPFPRLVLEYFPKRVPFRGSFWSAIQKESLFEALFEVLSAKCPFLRLVLGRFPKKNLPQAPIDTFQSWEPLS